MDAQAPSPRKLTTTAYAVLGLLALRDWTTYELAQQMERGIGRMWPASPSMVYESPKLLVAHGYATVTDTPVGRRPRSRYSITTAGRQALAAWLTADSAPPALQFEGLLKIVFADQGDEPTNKALLAEVAAWAREALAATTARAQSYLDDDYIVGVDLSDRAIIIAQTLGFLAEFYDLAERWSAWAATIAGSPDGPETARGVFAAIAEGTRPLR